MNTITKTLYTALALLAMTTIALAQVVEKKSLNLDGAKKVIDTVKAEAKKLNAPGGAIAVVDDGGNLLALERLDGTFAAGSTISIGKARTAALFKRETKAFEEIIKNGRTAMVTLPDTLFTPLQGGVLDGSVTLVTGGTVVEPKAIGPGEIRGREISGGDTRTISKGDVIIVPAGTPHWFKEVPGPLNYYVVKAR